MNQVPIIDAWAQPLRREAFAKMPEVARLFQQSGSAHLLDTMLTPEQTVALMDEAGVQTLMLSAWHLLRAEGGAVGYAQRCRSRVRACLP